MGYGFDDKPVKEFADLARCDLLAYVQYSFRGSRVLLWPQYRVKNGKIAKVAASAVPDVGALPVIPTGQSDKYRLERDFGHMVIAKINDTSIQANKSYGQNERHMYNAAINVSRSDSVVSFERFDSSPLSNQLVQIVYVRETGISFEKPVEGFLHLDVDQAAPQCRYILVSPTNSGKAYGPFEVGDSTDNAFTVVPARSADQMVRAFLIRDLESRLELMGEHGTPYCEFASLDEVESPSASQPGAFDWMDDKQLSALMTRCAKALGGDATRQQLKALGEAIAAGTELAGIEVSPARRKRMAKAIGAGEEWAEMSTEKRREAVSDLEPAQVADFVLNDESFDGFMQKALEDARVKERYEQMESELAAGVREKERELKSVAEQVAGAKADLSRTLADREKALEKVLSEHRSEVDEAEQAAESLKAEKEALQNEVSELEEAKVSAKTAFKKVVNDLSDDFTATQKLIESALVREIASSLAPRAEAPDAPVRAEGAPAAGGEEPVPVPRMARAAGKMAPEKVLDLICGAVNGPGGRELARNEVANLAICLTQGYVTVLAGLPGTGKTSLAEILAGALGLRQPGAERFAEVAVERGWASYKDFIGYYNPFTSRLEPASTAAWAAFEEMTREKEAAPEDPAMRLVLLDEANLSPMEHYFSPLMMACDSFNRKDASIELGGGMSVAAPSWLRFIATVNFDHTTEELSPRFLDRAWTVMLEPADPGEDFSTDPDDEALEARAALPMSALTRAFGKRPVPIPAAMDAKLSEALGACADARMPVSPRSIRMMNGYVSAACEVMDLGSAQSAYEPVDFALVQKVLPQISGPADKAAPLLERLAKISGLPRTRRRAEEMLKEADDGYCGFFC